MGIGSSATILKPNIDACGPSLIHVIDTVLLPFSVEATSVQPPTEVATNAG